MQIVPADIVGIGAQAFIFNAQTDGLRDRDVALTKTLLASFEPLALPKRVKTSLLFHEYLHWTRLIQMRWPLLITGLESLVHIDERSKAKGASGGWKSTEQFVRRLSKLQEFVPHLRWTQKDLTAIYELRSAFVHATGGEFDALRGRPARLYRLAERGMRLILQAAILRPAVADLFISDGSIRTALGFRD